MANDLVVKLLLKTGQFTTDLKNAKGQVQSFQTGVTKINGSIQGFTSGLGLNIGQLAKFGTAAGAAALAGKELKAIIDSNQTSSDAFNTAIAGAKGAINEFNYAMASADFTSFHNGIWGIVDAAREAAAALDQLGNTDLSFNMEMGFINTDFQKALDVYRDKKSTPEQKEEAKKKMEELRDQAQEDADNAVKVVNDAWKKVLVSKAGSSNLDIRNVTLDAFRRAMSVDLGSDPKTIRKNVNAQYKEYQKAIKEYGDNNIMGQQAVKDKYADTIIQHTALEKMSDKQLQELVATVSKIPQYQQAAETLNKAYIRATNSEVTTGTGGSGSGSHSSSVKSQKEQLELQEGSVSLLKEQVSEAQKILDSLTPATDEWNNQFAIVESLNKQLLEAQVNVENYKNRLAEQEKGTLPNVDSSNLTGKAELGYSEKLTPNGIEKIVPKQSISEMENLISVFRQWRDELKEGDPMIDVYNQKMQALQGTIDRMQSQGLSAPSTDKWEGFNSAMAETSTIVSNLATTFQSASDSGAQAILNMVATSLPAIGSLISAISALTAAKTVEAGVEGVEKGVSTSKNWIEAIAAVAAITAAIATAISSVKSMKSSMGTASNYATGGIVPGSSFSGDRVQANLNSGEMILNRDQQYSLWRQINNGGAGGGQVEFHISGTDLVGTLNNYNRKSKLTR